MFSTLGPLVALFVSAAAGNAMLTNNRPAHWFRNLDGRQKPAMGKLNLIRQKQQLTKTSEGLRRGNVLQRRLKDETKISLPVGIWVTRGYGYVLQVTHEEMTNRTEVVIFEETAISCVFLSDSLEDSVYAIELIDNATALIDVGTNAPYLADKVQEFQGACASGITEPDGMPLQDYDILVQTFNEHYAYFQERGIGDWNALTTQVRSVLSGNSTAQDLAKAFETILKPFDDAHVYAYYEALDAEIVSKPNSLFERLLDEFANQTEEMDPFDYLNGQLIGSFNVIDEYLLPTGLHGSLGSITWGGIATGGHANASNSSVQIGYINIFTFGPDDDSLDVYLADWHAAMTFVQDYDALVIDIRLNDGGSDVLAVYTASYFAASETFAYTLQPVDDNGELVEPPVEVFMDPEAFGVDIPFLGKPIVLLQSEISVSAAETFGLSMIQLPNVITVGQPTAGSFSDTLVRTTPNGWEFGLSNEYVRAPNGVVYEGVGIPAEVVISGHVLPLMDRQAGVDTWLDVAFGTAMNAAMATSIPTSSPITMTPTNASVKTQVPTTEMTSSAGFHHGFPGILVLSLVCGLAQTVF